MKKYYYITIVAALAIVCLQAVYLKNLYNRYFDEYIIKVNDAVHIALDKELHLRSLKEEGKSPKAHQYLYAKPVSDMLPEETDSLRRRSIAGDTINVDVARENGIGKTTGEIISQLRQDIAQKRGFPLELQVLDSIFVNALEDSPCHTILLYDKHKLVIDSIGSLNNGKSNYASGLYPIGTKGLQYLQVKADILMASFVKLHIWTLAFSACFMLVALFSLIYQLVVIRRKEELLRKREESINGTIHDLKAPLNSVVAMLSWLKMNETDLKKKGNIEVSQSGIKHLVYNIESMLVVARRDRKKIVLNKTEIDVLALVERVKKELDMLYRGKSHTIEIVNELPEGFRISADGMYIENVTRNLIENSLKYSDEGVAVEVSLSIKEGVLQVSVEDNGWGIAPCYQKDLFKQFYQVPRSKECVQKGYGIGLTQAKYIINEHGGNIKVKSAEKEGSIFTFTIPLTKIK
ncbi:HAMP domain-containing sensor histidine kinase [uncultured Bacteroides sp.]|uniref:sensor histidine kinase n=1 Tax=uncultured Bacteroides sp. TaxID=162156 RepID=UPI0025FF1DFB|nr:HAMP domain-containing sensor histidine kinase [uncultured Bacteroides sp.]